MSLYSRKSHHQLRIEALMLRASQELPLVPTIPSYYVRLLRAKLILEEALETVAALGVHVVIRQPSPSLVFDDLDFDPMPPHVVDLVEVVDGCCDISVVTIGTLSAFGIPDLPFLEEVDENNLQKFGPGGYLADGTEEHPGPAGKWMKPKNHQPPQIQKLLTQLEGYVPNA